MKHATVRTKLSWTASRKRQAILLKADNWRQSSIKILSVWWENVTTAETLGGDAFSVVVLLFSVPDLSLYFSNNKCILSQQDLDTYIYGDDGPLRGCSLCQKLALSIRNKFFKADESVRKCLRDKFSAAVVDELQPCIQKELNDYSFIIPPLPDFDRSTKDFLDVV